MGHRNAIRAAGKEEGHPRDLNREEAVSAARINSHLQLTTGLDCTYHAEKMDKSTRWHVDIDEYFEQEKMEEMVMERDEM